MYIYKKNGKSDYSIYVAASIFFFLGGSAIIKVSLIAQEVLKKQATETVAATAHNSASPYEENN